MMKLSIVVPVYNEEKTKSPNWGLLDKKRFEWMEKQEINQLRKFSIQKA